METSGFINLASSGNQAKIKQLSCLSLLTEWKYCSETLPTWRSTGRSQMTQLGLASRQLSEGAVSVSRRALWWIYQGQEKKWSLRLQGGVHLTLVLLVRRESEKYFLAIMPRHGQPVGYPALKEAHKSQWKISSSFQGCGGDPATFMLHNLCPGRLTLC